MSEEQRSPETSDRAAADAWATVGPATSIAPCSLHTFKAGGHQLVVGRTEDGAPFALDNRCPHEGYPLAQGQVAGDRLTCCWHNWKFRVGDGRCVLGGEDVRAYPVREQDGALEVDLTEPDPSEVIPGVLASFADGLDRHENGRVVRDGVRLIGLGYDPRRLLGEIARRDAMHAEYGSSHVLALAADCTRPLDRLEGPAAMHALAPVCDLYGETNARLPEHSRVAALDGASEKDLQAAIEAEDGERAEALLRGAFAGGVASEEIVGWLYGALAEHFTDFGHQLIYLVKTEELLAHVDRDAFADILSGLVRGMVLATREDLLPYWSGYASRFAVIRDNLEDAWAAADPDAPFARDELTAAVLDGSITEANDSLWAAIRSGVAAPRIARALVAAGAERLLRFDARHDADPEVAENWLWATHRFTFAAAVRVACERFARPAALRFLFQAMAFIHSGRAMDLPEAERLDPTAGGSAEVDAILGAIERRDAPVAVAGVSAHLADRGLTSELRHALEDRSIHSGLVRPIFIAHAIKTTFAALDEHDALGALGALGDDPARTLPVLAATRLLASPIQEQRLEALVDTSIRFVVEGKLPRKLTQ